MLRVEFSVRAPGVGGAHGGGEQRQDIRVVVADGVQVIDVGVVNVVDIVVILLAGEEPPAAVGAALAGLFPVAPAHLLAQDGDMVGGEAAAGALPAGEVELELRGPQLVLLLSGRDVPQAAGPGGAVVQEGSDQSGPQVQALVQLGDRKSVV